ncbi:MAG: insulinase family protein, partial [Spirochaetes bacterium]|nr:insulinase family protein [Spirochaetota bacterium]
VVEEREGCTVLSHLMFTNKIAYMNLLFDTTSVPQEDLPYITLLAQVMGNISTEKYEYADLSNEVNINTGGIHFNPETFGEKEDDSIYYPKFVVKSKALINKLPRLCQLIGELTGHTRFDEKKRLREIIQETKSRMEMSIHEHGHLIAAGRLLSYFSPIGKYTETIAGLSLYKFIAKIERNFDEEADKISGKLYEVAKKVFNRRKLIVSITVSDEDYKVFIENFSGIMEHLGSDTREDILYPFDLNTKNEGLLTPGKVQYVAKGFNFRRLGHTYNGSLQVLRAITSMDYLWNRVRVQGGAYGCFARIARNGNMYFCSYRDPNLAGTLTAYDEAENYLKVFDADQREMTKYIIGTISKLDAP